MSPHEKLVVAVVVGVLLVAGLGWAFHWWVLDVRYWFRWLPKFGRIVMPDRFDSDSAGGREAYPDPGPSSRTLAYDAWDRLNPDQAADLLIAEWRDDSPGRDWDSSRTPAPAAGGHHLPWRERMWWDDPDLTVWDARQAALRCWEILHIEFPRLRAELGIPA